MQRYNWFSVFLLPRTASPQISDGTYQVPFEQRLWAFSRQWCPTWPQGRPHQECWSKEIGNMKVVKELKSGTRIRKSAELCDVWISTVQRLRSLAYRRKAGNTYFYLITLPSASNFIVTLCVIAWFWYVFPIEIFIRGTQVHFKTPSPKGSIDVGLPRRANTSSFVLHSVTALKLFSRNFLLCLMFDLIIATGMMILSPKRV